MPRAPGRLHWRVWESDWTRSILRPVRPERWAFARDGRLLWGHGGVCHVQWLETPRPRGPHPLASVVLEWWKVRAAKAVSN